MWLFNLCPKIFLFRKVLRCDLMNALGKKRLELHRRLNSIIFQQDNAPAHTAVQTQLDIKLFEIWTILAPALKSSCSSTGLCCFPKLKSPLQSIKFYDFGELKRATLNAVRSFETDWCQSVYVKRVARYKKCVHLDGVYFDKRLVLI